tara:strand:- start:314 stop:457 length:144 start_codon:yes stop_codon:yes gene_type:complete
MDSTVDPDKLYEVMKKSGMSIKEAIIMLENIKPPSQEQNKKDEKFII